MKGSRRVLPPRNPLMIPNASILGSAPFLRTPGFCPLHTSNNSTALYRIPSDATTISGTSNSQLLRPRRGEPLFKMVSVEALQVFSRSNPQAYFERQVALPDDGKQIPEKRFTLHGDGIGEYVDVILESAVKLSRRRPHLKEDFVERPMGVSGLFNNLATRLTNCSLRSKAV